jgi:peroxiredoxin
MNQTIGKQLPDFELPDQDGQTAQLSELVGKFPFILTFYRGYW